jgi:hypothetical protein
MDSYILDFTDAKNLKIKTLGELEIVNIPYIFNIENGKILEENGDILYSVQKLESNRLSLTMGDNSTTVVNFNNLQSSNIVLHDSEILVLLQNKKWGKDTNTILFTNEPYKVLNEIDTHFKVFFEKDEKNQEIYRGAWLLDSYDGSIFLELFSERYNIKVIYQIKEISENSIKAIATDETGEFLILEFNK